MPQWIHNRAEHLLAKNPSMDKGQAFAIATQQSHALGKSPKGYGTPEGRSTAKGKYPTPKDDKKTANPGGLDSPKLAFADELSKIALVERLVRLGATDVPGTPRLMMRQRSPEELANLQQSVTDSWDKAVAPAKVKATAFAHKVPTEKGKAMTEAALHGLIDNPEALALLPVPLPGVALGATVAKHGLENLIDRYAPLQKAAFNAGGGYLLDQVGKPKVRTRSVEPPEASLKVAMFPTTPTPMGTTGMQAQKQLMKSQQVGTTDDKNSVQFKPLNQTGTKVPGVANSASGVKMAAALMAKWAFGSTGFGPTGGVFRPQYESYQGTTPIASPVVMDPRIKHGGNCPPSTKKVAFSQSGFGQATSLGAYGGNGGYHESYQGQTPIPSAVVMDPRIKRAGEALRKAASIPLTPQGRLSSSSREGKPKSTGFGGPSIASVSKPVGFGSALPGASKNGI
jgi:hypothetical protein